MTKEVMPEDILNLVLDSDVDTFVKLAMAQDMKKQINILMFLDSLGNLAEEPPNGDTALEALEDLRISHSHMCPKCETTWSHTLIRVLLSPIPPHDCPNCGTEQDTRYHGPKPIEYPNYGEVYI